MSFTVDHTHEPNRKSWVASANAADHDFPLQNLPFAVFSIDEQACRIGVAIGEQILDLEACALEGMLPDASAAAASSEVLNELMALPAQARLELRHAIFALLEESASAEVQAQVQACLVDASAVEFHMPARVGDYTDFYASVHHATNVGKLFRPDNPLLPNYKHIPIGYHGRASSLVVSGTDVKRPHGQSKAPDAESPSFGPSKLLDYELEVGIFVGPGNAMGDTIPMAEAHEHFFGLCLLNDWSARDLQAWEYQPLGPFLGKSFASTLSPWVITAEALAPYRVAAYTRPEGDPQPLDYLMTEQDQSAGAFDLDLEVWLRTAQMTEQGLPAERLSRTNFQYLYWTVGQMITHHASNGCNMQPGDFLGSGTVSGDSKDAFGCLLEITRRGQEPVQLASGEERKFLQDGDELILRGSCQGEGRARIGFGECAGRIVG